MLAIKKLLHINNRIHRCISIQNVSLGLLIPCKIQARLFSNKVRSLKDAPEGLRPWQLLGLRIFGYFRKDSLRIRQAQAIYRSCVQQAESPSILRALELPDDKFLTRHQLISVHVWIVNKRLLQEGTKAAKKLQAEVFDTLWENTERRVRNAGVAETSLSKSMAEIQKISFGAMVSYDIGLKIKDDDDFELSSAVWRNLFASRENVTDDKVIRVAKWMRAEVNRVSSIPFDVIEEGQLDFTLPEGVEVTDQDKTLSVNKGLDGEWRRALAVSGQYYWWNVKTRESTWDNPINK